MAITRRKQKQHQIHTKIKPQTQEKTDITSTKISSFRPCSTLQYPPPRIRTEVLRRFVASKPRSWSDWASLYNHSHLITTHHHQSPALSTTVATVMIAGGVSTSWYPFHSGESELTFVCGRGLPVSLMQNGVKLIWSSGEDNCTSTPPSLQSSHSHHPSRSTEEYDCTSNSPFSN